MSVQDMIDRMTADATRKVDEMTDAFEAAATEKWGPNVIGKLQAKAWREGYEAGVLDERTANGWDYPALPNRANPYR